MVSSLKYDYTCRTQAISEAEHFDPQHGELGPALRLQLRLEH